MDVWRLGLCRAFYEIIRIYCRDRRGGGGGYRFGVGRLKLIFPRVARRELNFLTSYVMEIRRVGVERRASQEYGAQHVV